MDELTTSNTDMRQDNLSLETPSLLSGKAVIATPAGVNYGPNDRAYNDNRRNRGNKYRSKFLDRVHVKIPPLINFTTSRTAATTEVRTLDELTTSIVGAANFEEIARSLVEKAPTDGDERQRRRSHAIVSQALAAPREG